MSEEQLKAFLEKVKADSSLQEKLKAAADSYAVLAIAKEEGFSISIDDIKAQQSGLSDKELENVAGGAGGAGGFDTKKLWYNWLIC
jgi:predicted ribosomally synthesized peptide with nif11-like leader